MNEDRTPVGDAELRMALRGLRQDVAPGHDLWPGIAARLHAPAHVLPEMGSARREWRWPLATAASLLLAVGIAWHFNPMTSMTPIAAMQPASAIVQASRPAISANRGTLVQREADGMTAHYQAALQELAPHAVPAGWQPGLDTLDRSALEIRSALQHDPNSRLLLQRLRDTYTRRLALARRALYA